MARVSPCGGWPLSVVNVEVVSTLTYFGPESAAQFGVLTTPVDSTVRGGVVVCGSLGKEQAETTRWLKLFAERLAARGFAVLRFDYPNTGESAGPQDVPDAVQRWTDGIAVAVEYLRASGVGHVVAVGHRMGALLLSQVNSSGVDRAVAWDPTISGRHYLRSKTVLYNMVSEVSDEVAQRLPADAIPPIPDDRVQLAGQSLSAEAAQELRSLRLVPGAFGATPTLLLSTDPAVASDFSGPSCHVMTLDDQEPFVSPSHPALLEFPERDIAAVVEWISSQSPTERHPIDPIIRTSAVVGQTAAGEEIRTEVYRTESGVTVWDTAIDHHMTHREVFVAHSLGQYVRSGPGRLWFTVALSVAAHGGRSIRFDRASVGESGTVDRADRELALYTRDYVADGVRLFSELTLPADARILHAGICVGSWMAAHGATTTAKALPDATSAVLLVNPLMWRMRPYRRFRIADFGADTGIDGTGRAEAEPDNSLAARLRRKAIWIGGRSGPLVRRRVPRSWWPAVGRLPWMSVPDALLAEIAQANVDVDLVFAPTDYAYFDDMSGADATFTSATRLRGVAVSAAGDHTSYHSAMHNVIATTALDALGLAQIKSASHPVTPASM